MGGTYHQVRFTVSKAHDFYFSGIRLKDGEHVYDVDSFSYDLFKGFGTITDLVVYEVLKQCQEPINFSDFHATCQTAR